MRLLLDLLPVVLVEPGQFVGPAGLLAAYRFVADTRDTIDQRASGQPGRPLPPVPLPHIAMNCVDVCPKGLNPTKAIGKIKEPLVRRAV